MSISPATALGPRQGLLLPLDPPAQHRLGGRGRGVRRVGPGAQLHHEAPAIVLGWEPSSIYIYIIHIYIYISYIYIYISYIYIYISYIYISYIYIIYIYISYIYRDIIYITTIITIIIRIISMLDWADLYELVTCHNVRYQISPNSHSLPNGSLNWNSIYWHNWTLLTLLFYSHKYITEGEAKWSHAKSNGLIQEPGIPNYTWYRQYRANGLKMWNRQDNQLHDHWL